MMIINKLFSDKGCYIFFSSPIGAILKPIMDSMSANPMGKPTVQGHRPTYDPVIPISQQQLIDSNASTNGSIHANDAPPAETTPAANQEAAAAGVGKDSKIDGGGAVKEGDDSVNNAESTKKEAENVTNDDTAASGSSNGERTLSDRKESSPKKSSAFDEELTEEKYQETMRRLRLPISSTLVLFKEVNVSMIESKDLQGDPKPWVPRTGPRTETCPGSGNIFKNIFWVRSGQVREFNVGSVQVGVFSTGVWDISFLRDKLKTCLSFPNWQSKMIIYS